jgi:geranylgeranyl pyrophosphate synthase
VINQRFYPLFRQVFLEVEQILRIWQADKYQARQLNNALGKLRRDFFDDKVFPALIGPWLAWQAIQPNSQATELTTLGAAHTLFYAFLDLTDDVEDNELSEQDWPEGSEAVAINTGSGLLFLALLALERLSAQGVSASVLAHLRLLFCQAGWYLTAGQHRDLISNQGVFTHPDEAITTMTLKTGTSVKLYFQSAAHLARATPEIEMLFANLGQAIGIMAQIRGDYLNIWEHLPSSDLSNHCQTLPILIGRHYLAENDQETLLVALAKAHQDLAAHTIIRHLLDKCQTRQHLNHYLETHRQKAQRNLDALTESGIQTQELSLFLDRIKAIE